MNDASHPVNLQQAVSHEFMKVYLHLLHKSLPTDSSGSCYKLKYNRRYLTHFVFGSKCCMEPSVVLTEVSYNFWMFNDYVEQRGGRSLFPLTLERRDNGESVKLEFIVNLEQFPVGDPSVEGTETACMPRSTIVACCNQILRDFDVPYRIGFNKVGASYDGFNPDYCWRIERDGEVVLGHVDGLEGREPLQVGSDGKVVIHV